MPKRYIGITSVEVEAMNNENYRRSSNNITNKPNPDALTEEQINRALQVLREKWGLN